MIIFLIFIAFVVLHLYGQHGMNRLGSYENRYGLMALVSIFGATVTGFIGLFVALGWWAFLVIAAVYVFLKYVRPKIFG